MIDLHLHTTISDGTWEPQEVVRRAHELGISTIAITDHERIEGIDPAMTEAAKYGIEVIPGIEFFAMDNGYERHMLGYFFDRRDPTLLPFLDDLAAFRDSQIEKILGLLEKEHGIHIPFDEILALSPGGFLGRAHIARALASGGHIGKTQDAFTAKFFGYDGLCYLPASQITPEDVIDVMNRFGGLSVLAHPGYYGEIDITEERLAELVSHGLGGLEVMHMRHTPEHMTILNRWAEKYSLLRTGGSDCHGTVYDPVKIGTVPVPDEWLGPLREWAADRK